jgi:hypothetical protein
MFQKNSEIWSHKTGGYTMTGIQVRQCVTEQYVGKEY